MTLNIFYGGDELNLRTGTWCASPLGCPRTFAKIVETVRASRADIVGLEEAEHNTRPLAEALGWYFNERTAVISRYPLIDPPAGNGVYVFAEIAPGNVVAVANVHLPAEPYGPYVARDGASRAAVTALERRVRLPAIRRQLRVLPELARAGIPVFLVGDFNSPSHLDWTRRVAALRKDVPYAVRWPVSAALARAGLRDSYREVHPDPVAVPGHTWTPGGPESNPREVHDRIDWVLAGGPAEARRSQVVGEAGGRNVGIQVDPYPSDHRGVVSTFDVRPGAPPLLVAVHDRRVTVGDDLAATFRAAGEPGERVAIVPAGGHPDEAPIELPTGDAVTDGEVVVEGGVAEPGAYDAVLLGSGGDVLSRSRFWAYEPDAPTRVATRKRLYRVGQPIEVSWSNAPGMRWDWLAVFEPTKRPNPFAETCNAGYCGNGAYLLYEYTAASIEGTRKIDARSFSGSGSWPLPPGWYEIRLLLDDGYRLVARSAVFQVVRG